MSTLQILEEIRALWSPSNATIRGISRLAKVSQPTIRRILRREGNVTHPIAVAVLAAVKSLSEVKNNAKQA
tara:strand:- start:3809 stop:4021 length:213 start_codon:yes stop_codon:yes gene_type:complete